MQDLKAIRFVEGTKISHDYHDNTIATFSYRHLISISTPAIGIPCKQNGLIVIDIDIAGASHKQDGREWWNKFYLESGMPPTYTVGTRSGGYHYYFSLPSSVNPDMFRPPGQLAPGVDVKYNGWVAAPPTNGYNPLYGTIADIQVAPPSLMMALANSIHGGPLKEFEFNGMVGGGSLDLHRPYDEDQIKQIRSQIAYFNISEGSLSRTEWRDAIFSLNAGVSDPEVLQELVTSLSQNKAYQPGDEDVAMNMVGRADKHGGVGPGTIFNILKNGIIRTGASPAISPFSRDEIMARSKVRTKLGDYNEIKMESNETNASQLLGAMYPADMLYHDARKDLFMFAGKAFADGELVNTLTPLVQSEVYGLGVEKFKRQTIAAGLEILMTARKIDPHKKWLETLHWDGVSRIDDFFIKYLGVEDSPYMRAVSKNFWISMAGRGVKPGIKFDYMIVLEGHEGIRKSSLVRAIGGEYTYAPSSTRLMDDLDELRKMHQSIIVELPELIGLINQNDEVVKNFLSLDRDSIRALYGRRAMEELRGFVFVGTTNSSKYLSTGMGHRRFWPIRIPPETKAIDIMGIESDRDQLFAEALKRYRDGELFHIVPEEDHAKIVRSRVIEEPLTAPVINMLPAMSPEFSLADMYNRLEMGGYIQKGLNASISRRIENALIASGCKETETSTGNKWRSGVVNAFGGVNVAAENFNFI